MGRTDQARGTQNEAPGLEEVLDLMIHELRNPIAVMKGFATTFEKALEKMDRHSIETGAQAIRRGVDKLDALLTSLKDARSLDLGELEIHPQRIMVSELIEEAVADQESLGHDRSINTSIEADVAVDVDSVRVRQILANLLSNAVKFSDPGTTIEIAVTVSGGKANICVKDEGRGIDPAKTDRLFGKFSRLTPEVKGTGIGLYISRGIARAHGGDIVLASNGDEGCAFLVTLPVAADDASN